MKRLIIITMLLFSSVTSSYALANDDYSGSINYLNPNKFVYSNGGVETFETIKLGDSGDYVITIPSLVDPMGIEIVGSNLLIPNEVLITGELETLSNCEITGDSWHCTFDVPYDDLDVSIRITGMDVKSYYEEYGFYKYQLEQGNKPSEYIPWFPKSVIKETNSGSGYYKTTYDTSLTIDDIIVDNLTAIDEIDGVISESITIVSDEYTSNKNVLGIYPVVVEAIDSNNNKTQFQLNVKVEDHMKPEIIGVDSMNIEVSDDLSLEEILLNYEGMDDYDGALPVVVSDDGYTSNMYSLGIYTVVINATDLSGNTTSKSLSLHVLDGIAPTLESDTLISTYQSNPKRLTEIINNLVVSDNYYAPSDVSIDVLSDNYTSNMNDKGTYSVMIRLSDPSGNYQDVELSITVKDDIKPEITGKNTIVLSYTDIKTVDYFKNLLVVSDNETLLTSSDLTVYHETYTANASTPGGYYITFKAIDESNNYRLFTIVVAVVDDQAPSISMVEEAIQVKSNSPASNADIINHLIETNEIDEDDYLVEIIEDNYTSNKDVPGTYLYSIKLTNNMGEEVIKRIGIEVTESSLLGLNMVSNEALNTIKSIAIYTLSTSLMVFVIIKMTKKK